MSIREHVPLAPETTLGVGGAARFFVEAQTEQEIDEAIAFARERSLSTFVLGNGSNILVPDAGYDGMVLKISLANITVEDEGENIRLVAGAGALWDDVVDTASAHGVFGIANLAGIPGTLGGAAVQNIGAYGAEFSEVFDYADSIDSRTGEKRRVTAGEASFAYRTSFFKEHRELIMTRIALRLRTQSKPNVAYADLARAQASGVSLDTPSEVARVVRAIRADKFPHASEEGTAGSFFKNPIITRELADSLALRFPGLPAYPHEDGRVKLSLAWLLDHALALKGYTEGFVRLYEKQPIVLVTRVGATASEVDAFAKDIAKKVFDATGMFIEREVEMVVARK